MVAASNTYFKYKAPMVWSFDSLRHLTVICILKTKRHRTYAVQYFRLIFFFNTELHSAELVGEFRFILQARTLTNPTDLLPEDGGSMYVVYTANIHIV
jgi:hypothetical protein